MIFKNQGTQYHSGTYYEKKTDTQGEEFRFEILTDKRNSYGQIVNNLIAVQGRMTILTNYDLPFKVNGYITTKNGKKYIVSETVELDSELNPQTNYWFKKNPNTDTVLSLTEIENVDEN